jgi:hypothetical protein
MKQRIFSHFQDYLIQYISHQYQDLSYCNSSQYILSTYNSQHDNNNNVVLAMTMPYSGIVIANTTLLYKYCCGCLFTFILDKVIVLFTFTNRVSHAKRSVLAKLEATFTIVLERVF